MTNADLYRILRPHAGRTLRVVLRSDGSVALIDDERNLVVMSADEPPAEAQP